MITDEDSAKQSPQLQTVILEGDIDDVMEGLNLLMSIDVSWDDNDDY